MMRMRKRCDARKGGGRQSYDDGFGDGYDVGYGDGSGVGGAKTWSRH